MATAQPQSSLQSGSWSLGHLSSFFLILLHPASLVLASNACQSVEVPAHRNHTGLPDWSYFKELLEFCHDWRPCPPTPHFPRQLWNHAIKGWLQSVTVHNSGVSVSGFARTWVFVWVCCPSQPAAFEAQTLRVWHFCQKGCRNVWNYDNTFNDTHWAISLKNKHLRCVSPCGKTARDMTAPQYSLSKSYDPKGDGIFLLTYCTFQTLSGSTLLKPRSASPLINTSKLMCKMGIFEICCVAIVLFEVRGRLNFAYPVYSHFPISEPYWFIYMKKLSTLLYNNRVDFVLWLLAPMLMSLLSIRSHAHLLIES